MNQGKTVKKGGEGGFFLKNFISRKVEKRNVTNEDDRRHGNEDM